MGRNGQYDKEEEEVLSLPVSSQVLSHPSSVQTICITFHS